jgi:hypothetical protein
MQRILIQLFACLVFTSTQLYAQVPQNISVPYPVKPDFGKHNPSEMLCNFAGTFQLGSPGVNTQSNDLTLNQIILCFGDSIFINHNGDADLSGDPTPATAPGVGWAFYNCPPTIQGDNLQTVLTDPCLTPGGANGMWVFTGNQEGDAWLFNTGTFQNTFNAGQPIELIFAPITFDYLDLTTSPSSQGWESSQVGFPPGPCVNVNTAAAFSVVYLNPIQASGISTNFGNDCLGKFRIQGGFPEFDGTALYTVDIVNAANPTIKGLIQAPAAAQYYHGVDIIFSVPQAGTYNVTIEDGKSCGHTFQITMGTCNPSDNVVFSLPDVVSPPGTNVCVPMTVQNFSTVSTSFSVSWDPTKLEYTGYTNVDTTITGFSTSNLNTQNVAMGQLGAIFYDNNPVGGVITIPNNDTLIYLCFNVIGALGECSPLTFTNSPTPIIVETPTGQLAVTANPGQVCADFLPLTMKVDVDTLCFGFADIRVTALGGTAPYEVIIDKPAGGPTYSNTIPIDGGTYTATNVTSGTYDITLKDNNGQGDSIKLTITLDLPSLGASVDVLSNQPSCNGLDDGSVSATVLVGTNIIANPGANYTFTWAGPAGPYPNSPTVTNAKAGLYTVLITDQNTGCFASASGTMGEPALIKRDSLGTTPAACSGVCNGAFTYRVKGGTPFTGNAYNYTWAYSPDGNQANAITDASGQGNPITLTGKCAGTYFVTITDSNNCEFLDSLVLTNGITVKIDLLTKVNISCAGLSDGEICINIKETPTSAAPNYSFFWSPPGFTQANGSAVSSCYSGLSAGTYNVLAIGASGVTAGCSDTASFTITEPTPVVVVKDIATNPICDQPNSGKIEIRGTGGTATVDPNSYDYIWNNGDTTRSIQNLAAGDYTATVTDLNGCTSTITITLTLPQPPAITAVDSSKVKCGNDGCLTVTATSTGGALQYTWKNIDGTLIPDGDSSTVCGLNGGGYIVEVIDQGGCLTIDTLSLAPTTPMSISDTTFLEPTCFGSKDGIITIGVVDGNGGYTYTWTPNTTPPSTSPVLNGVPAGCYTVKITDSEGCTLSQQLCLGEPPAITNTFPTASIQNVTCFGDCTGQASPVVKYADGTSGAFIFQWEGGSSDSARIDLCAGTTSVTISDSKGCFIVDSVAITAPPAITAFVETIDSVKCYGGSDGRISISGQGGNGSPYSYQWSPNTNNPNDTQTVNNLEADVYDVTITDGQGCTGTETFTVYQPGEIVVTAQTEQPSCFGSDDGIITATIVGGNTGTVSYEWSDGTQVIGSINPQDSLAAGTYAVTVTDALGCTGLLENIVLLDPPAILGSYNPLDPIECSGDQTILTIDTIYGGTGGPYQYSIDNGVTLNPSFPVSISGGEHFISYFDNSGKCSITDTINVFEPNAIEITFDPINIELELGDSIVLNPIITGLYNGAPESFVWTPVERLLNLPTLTPTVYTFESQEFTLTVVDSNGCIGTGSVLVNIDPNRNVYIPNIFIPGNPKGLNDHFSPWIGKGVDNINFMKVYDRWGELMYERKDFLPENQPSLGWDGRYKGDYVNPGVYVYAIEVKFLDGRVLLYRGDVTVYR